MIQHISEWKVRQHSVFQAEKWDNHMCFKQSNQQSMIQVEKSDNQSTTQAEKSDNQVYLKTLESHYFWFAVFITLILQLE